MKKLFALLVLCPAIAFGASGDPFVVSKGDLNSQMDEFVIRAKEGDTITWRAYLYVDGEQWQGDTNYGGVAAYFTNYFNSTNAVRIAGTMNTATNFVLFQFSAADTATNGTFLLQYKVTNNVTGRTWTFPNGKLVLDKNPIKTLDSPLRLIYLPNGLFLGDTIYFDGANWQRLAAGVTGQFLQTRSTNAAPIWATYYWWTNKPTTALNITTNSHPGAGNTRLLASKDGTNLSFEVSSGDGDFMADGSVPMIGNFNGGGHYVTNAHKIVLDDAPGSLIQFDTSEDFYDGMPGDGSIRRYINGTSYGWFVDEYDNANKVIDSLAAGVEDDQGVNVEQLNNSNAVAIASSLNGASHTNTSQIVRSGSNGVFKASYGTNLTAALTACAPYDNVIIPPGIYDLRFIALTNGVTIVGAGKDATTLNQSGAYGWYVMGTNTFVGFTYDFNTNMYQYGSLVVYHTLNMFDCRVAGLPAFTNHTPANIFSVINAWDCDWDVGVWVEAGSFNAHHCSFKLPVRRAANGYFYDYGSTFEQDIIYAGADLVPSGWHFTKAGTTSNHVANYGQVQAYIANGINTDVIPAVSNAYDLGSSLKPWRDLYLGNGSVYMGGTKIFSYDGTGTLAIVSGMLELKADALAEKESIMRIWNPDNDAYVDIQWDADADQGLEIVGGTYVLFPTVKNLSANWEATGGTMDEWGFSESGGWLLFSTIDPNADIFAITQTGLVLFAGSYYGDGSKLTGISYTESDPTWVGVSNDVVTKANNGQTAYGWGDHGTNGYLKTESDPTWAGVSNDVITKADNGQTAYGWGNHSTNSYLKTESDPTWAGISNDIITKANNGQTAYDWGNHGTNNYATKAYANNSANTTNWGNSVVDGDLNFGAWAFKSQPVWGNWYNCMPAVDSFWGAESTNVQLVVVQGTVYRWEKEAYDNAGKSITNLATGTGPSYATRLDQVQGMTNDAIAAAKDYTDSRLGEGRWTFTVANPTNAVYIYHGSADLPMAATVTSFGMYCQGPAVTCSLVQYSNITNTQNNYITVYTNLVGLANGWSNVVVSIPYAAGKRWDVVQSLPASGVTNWQVILGYTY